MRKWFRPVVVFPLLALTVHYGSVSRLLFHMALAAAGGLFVEWMAISMAAKEKT